MYDKRGLRMYWWSRLVEDTNFQNNLRCRWEELRKGPLSYSNIAFYIDSVVIAINNIQEKNHNIWNTIGRYVWPNNFIGETYQEEIDYLENWLYKRLIWMDENIPGKCTSSDVYFADGSNESSVTTYPNPFNERLTFELYVDKTSNINLEIYDLPGKRIYNVSLYNMGTGKHIFL